MAEGVVLDNHHRGDVEQRARRLEREGYTYTADLLREIEGTGEQVPVLLAEIRRLREIARDARGYVNDYRLDVGGTEGYEHEEAEACGLLERIDAALAGDAS